MFNYAVEPRRLLDTRPFRQFLRSRRVAALQAARYFVDKGELAETTDGSSATDPRTSRALHPTQVHLRTQMDAGQRGDLGPRAPPPPGNLRLQAASAWLAAPSYHGIAG